MNNILCIVGPTGTGKTAKAIELSKEQPSILVSADSRQVYRSMDIVTAKDHPKNITIYGVDIVEPDESCSVAVWHNSVMPHIKQAWREDKLPVVVGGTGLYVKALTDGIETIGVPINRALRDELIPLSIIELQDKLKFLDKRKFETMNHSDLNNSRRLIRAIEVASSDISLSPASGIPDSRVMAISPGDPIIYHDIILKRVISRIEKGAIEETKHLLSKYDKDLQSMSAIGYKSIIDFIGGKCSQDEMIEHWVTDELAYSSRQMTWFRKVKSIEWYDIDIKEV